MKSTQAHTPFGETGDVTAVRTLCQLDHLCLTAPCRPPTTPPLAYLRSGKRLEFELLFVKFMAVSIGLAGYTLPTHGVVVPAAFLRPPHKLDTKEALARTMAAARRGRAGGS